MRSWKIDRYKDGIPVEWRSRPWTILKMGEMFGLWYDYKAKPECWSVDLEDAKQMARMFEEND